MNSLIDFISNNEVSIMIALLVTIILLTIIVLITDALNKRKNKKDVKELLNNHDTDITDVFKEDINEENFAKTQEYTMDLEQYNDVIDNDNKLTEIKYVEDDEELEKTKAQLELKNLKEELIKADIKEKEEAKKKLELEKQQDEIIDVIDIDNNPIDKFEQEQEENAIISLDEFNKVSDKIYDENEEIQYKDEGNEPISIQELEALYNTKELKAIKIDEEIVKPTVSKLETKTEKKEEDYKFKKSPIISPVFGLDNDESVNTIALENTANLDKLSEEIKRTNEFLNTLRELRKNLQK